MGGNSAAMASLCELDVDDAQLMSMVAETETTSAEAIFQRATISGAAGGQECDARNPNDCDINIPGGEPQAPNSVSSMRPNAALAQEQAKLLAPPRAPACYSSRTQGPRAGHYPSIDRPPRS